MGGYDVLSLESRTLQSPWLGGLIIGDSFFISGIYRYNAFTKEPPPDRAGYFHTMEVTAETHQGRHQWLSSFKTQSDHPEQGGWGNKQVTILYNYQTLVRKDFDLRLGAGFALGDFGIQMEDGSSWPLIPVPYLGILYNTPLLTADFSFVVGPNLSFTLFPEGNIRITGEGGLNNFRDIRDLEFTTAFHYRFFDKDSSQQDITGISAGISNTSLGFIEGGTKETYELQYYSFFTELDLTLLKITGGYTWDGQERLDNQPLGKVGAGYFLNLQAMYQF